MGATGFTGRLIAAELRRAGVEFAIAGRNRPRLEELSRSLDGAEWMAADVADPASLAALAARSAVIINCVGPFTDLGAPVVSAAIAGGAHYLDTTGEQPFVKALRERDAAAKERGVALVPAMAFEVALSDCAAALAGDGFSDITAIHVTYASRFHPSQGTQRTVIRMLSSGGYAYVGGNWVAEPPGRRKKRVRFPAPVGEAVAVSFPSAEVFTIPAHQRVREVRAFMAVSRLAAPVVAMAAPALPAVAGVLGWLAARWIGTGTGGPDPATRAADRFDIAVDARGIWQGRARARRVLLSGRDPYGLTAAVAVYGAQVMRRPEFRAAGVLPPAAVVPPREFLESLRPHGLTWTIEED